jgi:hypothetical protein
MADMYNTRFSPSQLFWVGLIAEHWHVADLLGMMKQIGGTPG